MSEFNIHKTIETCYRIISNIGTDNSLSYKKLIKLLYLVDKNCYSIYQKTITNDKYLSMPEGPVLQKVFTLIVKGEKYLHLVKEHVNKWGEYFNTEFNIPSAGKHIITYNARKPVEITNLSEEELFIIDIICDDYGHYSEESLVNLLHDSCLEWQKHGTEKNANGEYEEITINDIKEVVLPLETVV